MTLGSTAQHPTKSLRVSRVHTAVGVVRRVYVSFRFYTALLTYTSEYHYHRPYLEPSVLRSLSHCCDVNRLGAITITINTLFASVYTDCHRRLGGGVVNVTHSDKCLWCGTYTQTRANYRH